MFDLKDGPKEEDNVQCVLVSRDKRSGYGRVIGVWVAESTAAADSDPAAAAGLEVAAAAGFSPAAAAESS